MEKMKVRVLYIFLELCRIVRILGLRVIIRKGIGKIIIFGVKVF